MYDTVCGPTSFHRLESYEEKPQRLLEQVSFAILLKECGEECVGVRERG